MAMTTDVDGFPVLGATTTPTLAAALRSRLHMRLIHVHPERPGP